MTNNLYVGMRVRMPDGRFGVIHNIDNLYMWVAVMPERQGMEYCLAESLRPAKNELLEISE